MVALREFILQLLILKADVSIIYNYALKLIIPHIYNNIKINNYYFLYKKQMIKMQASMFISKISKVNWFYPK